MTLKEHANSLARAAGPLVLAVLLLLAWPKLAEAQDAGSCNEKPLQAAQAQCFFELVKAAADPDVCDGAADPVVRFHCLSRYAEHSLDPAPCARIATEDPETLTLRDACIAGVAVARRDPEVCGGAELPALRNACYMLLVMDHGADPAYCARIEGDVLKEACSSAPQ